MSILSFIKSLNDRGIVLEKRDQKLSVRGRLKQLTKSQLLEIKANKAEILSVLESQLMSGAETASIGLEKSVEPQQNPIELSPSEFDNVVDVFRTLLLWKSSNSQNSETKEMLCRLGS